MNNTIKEYYLLALVDLVDGSPVKELEEAIKVYEKLEAYEACAGIQKAIKESEYLTLRDIKNILKNENTRD